MKILSVKVLWDLEFNAFLVIGISLVILIFIIWFKKYYNKHSLEITKVSFLFNLFGFEYEPIKDKEKIKLIQEIADLKANHRIEIENKDKEIKSLNKQIKKLNKNDLDITIKSLILVIISNIVLWKYNRKNKQTE